MNLNATLFAQLVVFLILAWFTMKFVWPPIMKALDERAGKIADGLAAADKAKTDLAHAEKKAAEELRKARESAAEFRSGAEKQVAQLIEEARAEGARGLRLYADERNSNAHAVYRRLGMNGDHYRVFELMF